MKAHRLAIAILTAAGVVSFGVTPGDAKPAKQLKAKSRAHSAKCTPINGRFGYYGNPWCDTGSYRLEDFEYRQRERAAKRALGANRQ